MTDYEQAYCDLRAGVEALRDEWRAAGFEIEPDQLDVLLASSAAATASEDWRDVPHVHAGTDCRGGDDCPARPEPCIAPPGNLCTETGCWDMDRCVVYPATASEGATELTGDESYPGDPCPEHGPHCHGDICRCADKHRPATGVTSSDGDRGLTKEECRQILLAYRDGVLAPGEAVLLEVERILAARTAQPEGVERVEWGVRGAEDNVFAVSENREWAERWLADPAVLIHRTVTEYAPVVGPWEVVGDE